MLIVAVWSTGITLRKVYLQSPVQTDGMLLTVTSTLAWLDKVFSRVKSIGSKRRCELYHLKVLVDI